MPSCAAINCTNRCEKGFRLFRLPANEHRKKQWLINMGRETWTPSKCPCVCEAHFEDSQWEQSRADGWKKLKPNAIPTIFDNPIVPITVIQSDAFRICRICLKVDDNLIDLFKPMSNNEEPYLELMEHTSLQVSSDDGLPPYVCKDCFETLQAIKNFKEKCIHSNNLLKNYIGPNKIENLIEYILSKTQTEGIWYIDNGDDFETTSVDKQQHKEKTEQLNNKNGDKLDETIDLPLEESVEKTKEKTEQLNDKITERLGKLDEFLEKQIEILEGPIQKIIESKQNECLKKLPCSLKRIDPFKPPVIRFPSNSTNNLPVIKEVIKVPKESFVSKYELQDFVCHICGKKVKYLDSHMRIHNTSLDHKCEICGKQFRQAILLRKHLVVHKGEKNYECGICQMAFTRAQVRNRHIQTVHEKIRRFTCTVCPKSFHLAYRLKVHMFTHTGERRYKCDVEGCTRQFTQRTPLITHKLKYHNSENNDWKLTYLQCTICAKVFKQKRYLVRHIRLHDVNEAKNLQCTICSRTFQKQMYLQEHLRVHAGVRPSKCNKCNKSFVSDRILKRHMRMHIRTTEKQIIVTKIEIPNPQQYLLDHV